MNPTPRTNDAPGEPDHPASQLQRFVSRRRRDVHRTSRTSGDERVLELPHPRFCREPRLRLIGRGGHGRQRRRRGVARRIDELAGSRPLPSRPLLRLVDAARSPVRSPSGAISPLPGLADLARLARLNGSPYQPRDRPTGEPGGGGGEADSGDGSSCGWSGCEFTMPSCAMSANGATAVGRRADLLCAPLRPPGPSSGRPHAVERPPLDASGTVL